MTDEICRRCKHPSNTIRKRYSFGVYAGRFCKSCCSGYRDNCGVGQPQGSAKDLDEPLEPEDYY